MKRIWLTNLLTLFVSGAMLIPLGEFIAQEIPLVATWALLLSAQKLPNVLLAYPLGQAATKFTERNVIWAMQGLSALMAIISLIAVYREAFGLLLVAYLILCFSKSPLQILFPSVINQLRDSEAKKNQKKTFSYWHMVLNASNLSGVVLGSFFASPGGLIILLALSVLIFSLSAVVWYQQEIELLSGVPKVDIEKGRAFLSHPLNLVNGARKITFGMINPLLPFFILSLFELPSEYLGILYLVAGISALLGANFGKRRNISSLAMPWLIILETALLSALVYSPGPMGVFILLGLSAFLASAIDVDLQSTFLRKFRFRSPTASACFEATSNLCLVAGYFYFVAVGVEEFRSFFLASALVILVFIMAQCLSEGARARAT